MIQPVRLCVGTALANQQLFKLKTLLHTLVIQAKIRFRESPQYQKIIHAKVSFNWSIKNTSVACRHKVDFLKKICMCIEKITYTILLLLAASACFSWQCLCSFQFCPEEHYPYPCQ
jgi:hypothetical protein